MKKPMLIALLTVFSVCSTTGNAANPLFGEVDLDTATRTEKNAGVWLNGQYLGYVRDLKGKSKLVLPPGEHNLLFKLIGFKDLARHVIVEPGQKIELIVSLAPDNDLVFPDEAELAELKLEVQPEEAAVFVNDVYAGYVDQFNGRRGMQMGPGVYDIRIALPGYNAFETAITIVANQAYEIKTTLPRASIVDQSRGLSVSQLAE